MKGGFYMSKKGLKLGVALAAGAGAAAILTKTSQENKEIKAAMSKKAEAARSDYRNTERGWDIFCSVLLRRLRSS